MMGWIGRRWGPIGRLNGLLALIGIVFVVGAGVSIDGRAGSKLMAVENRVRRALLVLNGGLVRVDGRLLRLDCRGEKGPTVVMDAGLGQSRATWGRVPGEVATFTRVCTYDRAGIGQSDPAPRPRTSADVVQDLHALLERASVPGPYVLVGHSFGGLNMRLYASQYPAEVAGLVLVDSSHEDQYERFAALLRPEEREEYLGHEGGANGEGIDLLTSAAQVRAASRLAAIPLVVLSINPERVPGIEDVPAAPWSRAYMELQAQLAALTPDSTHWILPDSGHFVQWDRPDAVVEGIRQVVEAARRAGGPGPVDEGSPPAS
jgi:pimeloyl-ACP methyl ester carboxylesterase